MRSVIIPLFLSFCILFAHNISAASPVNVWAFINSVSELQRTEEQQVVTTTLRYWESKVNSAGGLEILTGDPSFINLTILDIGGQQRVDGVTPNSALIERATFGGLGPIDLILAPADEESVEIVLESANTYGVQVISGLLKDGHTFKTHEGGRAFPNAWNTAESLHLALLTAVQSSFIAGASSILPLTDGSERAEEELEGAEEHAEGLRMEFLDLVGFDTSANAADAKQEALRVALQLEKANADVVLGSIEDVNSCIELVRALKSISYMPHALFLSPCASDPTFSAELGEDGLYVLYTSRWDERVDGPKYRDSSETSLSLWSPSLSPSLTASEVFVNDFVRNTSLSVSPTVVNVMAMCVVVQKAVLRLSSLDFSPLSSLIQTLDDASPFGEIHFNGFGEQIHSHGDDGVIVQYRKALSEREREKQEIEKGERESMVISTSTLYASLIHPIFSATSPFLYPSPTWKEREFKPEYFGTYHTILVLVVLANCLIFTLLLMGFWIKNRTATVVKASNYPLSVCTLFGAILIYGAVYSWWIEANSSACLMRVWLGTVGFTLFFASIVVKMGSLYDVFTRKNMTQSADKRDRKMLLSLSVFVVIDLIFNSIWTALDPVQYEEEVLDSDRLALNESGCSNGGWWLIASAIEKLIVLFIGVFLAWKTRDIPTLFNDSKNVTGAVFVVLFVAAVVTPIVVSDTMKREDLFLIRSLSIIFCAIFAISTLFLPRLMLMNKFGVYAPLRVVEQGIRRGSTIGPSPSLQMDVLRETGYGRRLVYGRTGSNTSPNSSRRSSRIGGGTGERERGGERSTEYSVDRQRSNEMLDNRAGPGSVDVVPNGEMPAVSELKDQLDKAKTLLHFYRLREASRSGSLHVHWAADVDNPTSETTTPGETPTGSLAIRSNGSGGANPYALEQAFLDMGFMSNSTLALNEILSGSVGSSATASVRNDKEREKGRVNVATVQFANDPERSGSNSPPLPPNMPMSPYVTPGGPQNGTFVHLPSNDSSENHTPESSRAPSHIDVVAVPPRVGKRLVGNKERESEKEREMERERGKGKKEKAFYEQFLVPMPQEPLLEESGDSADAYTSSDDDY